MEVMMHLFHCVICDGPMSDLGRAEDGRCTYCLSVFSGVSTEDAKRQLTPMTSNLAQPPKETV